MPIGEVKLRTPAQLKESWIIAACVGLVVGVVALGIFMLEDPVAQLMLGFSAVVASVAAFGAGNAYSLRDWRRRVVRNTRTLPADQRPALPPSETITHRLRAAFAASTIGLLGLFGTGALAGYGDSGTVVTVAAGAVAAMLCGLGGSLTRPLDQGLIEIERS